MLIVESLLTQMIYLQFNLETSSLIELQRVTEKKNADIRTRFESLRGVWWPPIRAIMDEVIHESSVDGSLLRRMADYHLQSEGKRLRAILPLKQLKLLGVDPAGWCLSEPDARCCTMRLSSMATFRWR